MLEKAFFFLKIFLSIFLTFLSRDIFYHKKIATKNKKGLDKGKRIVYKEPHLMPR